jgi:hypothetical protein
MNEPWKGFVFLDVNNDLLLEPHDLGHGLTLRRATEDELRDQTIDINFQSWSGRRGMYGFINQRMSLPDAAQGTQTGGPLPNPKDWRHAVIESADKNVFYWNVNLAFSISRADLRIGFIRFENNAQATPYLEFPMLFIRNPLGGLFVDHKLPSYNDLTEIRQNISHVLTKMTPGFPSEIREIIHLFSSLDNLPDQSQFKVLGYFSVIEGILSHAPENSDRTDSIQRQLIRNINLLNNRLKKIDREINFGEFGATKPEKVLTRLYSYRSAIAHGSNVSSSLSNIQKIRLGGQKVDHLWIHDWLRDMTKKLLLAAIVEPELICDLK